jgi:hypothetical protein
MGERRAGLGNYRHRRNYRQLNFENGDTSPGYFIVPFDSPSEKNGE